LRLEVKSKEMTKTKYAIVSFATILPLIALVPFLQLQTVTAQTDNSGNDNSGSGPSFAERHPTFCTLGPLAGYIGHPVLGILIGVICTLP
jgi:hypothetical protein